MVYSLKVQHVEPEEIVIKQADNIFNEEVEPIQYYPDKAQFYIILNGNFKVVSLKFNERKKNKAYNASDDLLRGSAEPIRSASKKLESGDYFGEVAFILNCKRTSTIKAKLYATLGCIDHITMLDMLRDFPDFKRHLLNDIVNIYDDDLKLFLTATLRKIDYLADVEEEIIVQLAYMCCPEIKEKGSLLYSMDEDPDE